MKTLLHIDSSQWTERSHSRQLTSQFVQAWRRANPNGTVVHRDLGLTPVPPITEDWITAAFSSPAERTSGQRAAIAVSDALVDELFDADELVIGAPMYNFGVAAALKAWIDRVVRIGRTIQYPDYTPLLKGKKMTLVATCGSGGMSPGEPLARLDAQVPYLIQILEFIGITDVSVVYAGSLNEFEAAREKSLEKARAEVKRLASR